uniref:Uncharacterized protein n=1 Tax=Alexandrium andersonii TaxID=327968 RepID=A0A7S2MLB9_9DINO
MAALFTALALCSLLSRAVAVSSAGPVSSCENASLCPGSSRCGATYGISLLRASAFKSKTRIFEEAEEAHTTVVEDIATLSSDTRMPASAPAEVGASPSTRGAAAAMLPPKASPLSAPVATQQPLLYGGSEAPQVVVPLGPRSSSVRLWSLRMKGFLLDVDGEVMPYALLAMAVVMLAATVAATVAAMVAMAALRRIKAVEQVQAPTRVSSDLIQGLPGEAYSLSAQEAKIKSPSDPVSGPLHRWEELREPEAEWDTDCPSCSSNT